MKQYWVIIVILALVALPGVSLSQAELNAGEPDIGDAFTPGLGNTGYDVQHYDLAFDIDFDTEGFSAVAGLDVVATLEGGLARFSLDYNGPPVQSVAVDGAEATWAREGSKLWVTLPEPVEAGEAFSVEVVYTGWPERFRSPLMPFLALGVYTFPEEEALFAFNEPDGAQGWFPCNDHPLDKATYTFRLTVPTHLTGVANGAPAEPVTNDDGSRTFRWEMAYPMATYLAVIAVADYEVYTVNSASGIPIRNYYFAGQDEDDVAATFDFTADVMTFFEEVFGPYPFDNYGHVMTLQGAVGMETQTMTIMPAGLVGAADPIIVVHELAHQWFGDYISPASWQDIWLNEGFATYAEALWVEYTRGDRAMVDYLNGMEQQVLGSGESHPLAEPELNQLFSTTSYEKGGWVLHMLRREVGNEAFIEILRAYLARFGGGTASTADFWDVAEEVAGRDLDGFFEQWLYRGENPALMAYWTQEGAVMLCQVQGQDDAPFLYEMPLGFSGAGVTSDIWTLTVDEPMEYAEFELDFNPTLLWVDPIQNVLAAVVEIESVETLPDTCPAD